MSNPRKKISYYLDTAFTISIVRGLCIAIALLVATPFIVKFFDAAEASRLLYLVSVVPLIRGFINPSIATLTKELRFRNEFSLRGILYAIDAIVAIGICYFTKSPIGFIWGMVAAAIAEVIISNTMIEPRPRLRFEREKFDYIMSHGKWVTGFGVLQYFYREGDDMVVVRLLGQSALGIYQAAYKISTMPVTEVADVLTRVTFPIYVKMAEDKTRLLRAFRKTFTISLLASSLFGTILLIFPELIVKILLGDRWISAVPLIQILAIFGVGRAAINSFDSLFLATKNQKYITYSSFVGTSIMLICIIPLIRVYGVNGAGYATVISVFAALPLSIYFSRKVFI